MSTLPTSSAPAPGTAGRPSGRATDRTATVALLGGLAYTGAWIAGLATAPAGTEVTSSGSEVRAAVAAHTTGTAAQYLLTEVVAAVALAVTVTAVARLTSRAALADGTAGTAARAARLLRATALVAAGLSLVQGILGLAITWVAVPRADDHLAGGLFEAISRTDGVKMLTLAALGVAGLRLGRAGLLPRWLTPVAAGLAVTVAVSGVGYLLLVPALATAAYASLPLLLLWVTGAGIAAARRATR